MTQNRARKPSLSTSIAGDGRITIGTFLTLAAVLALSLSISHAGDSAVIDPGNYRPRPIAAVQAASVAMSAPATEETAIEIPAGWKKLRRGMSRAEATAAVGEPRWEEKTLAFDFWMYQRESIMAAGVLIFDGQSLSSYRLPDGPLPRN